MKKIPWAGIGTACVILLVLVIGRCAVTAGRVLYYNGTDWQIKVMDDPWFYVGIAAAALGLIAFLQTGLPKKKETSEEE